jgi:hypothetical protein
MHKKDLLGKVEPFPVFFLGFIINKEIFAVVSRPGQKKEIYFETSPHPHSWFQ